MTTIRTPCPICGPVELPPEDVLLCGYEDGWAFSFDCPMCESEIERRAPEHVVDALKLAGVPIWAQSDARFAPLSTFEIPVEIAELEDDAALAQFLGA